MKASELRIGNYYNHNGEVKTVNVNVIEEVWNSERSWCKPIPLTEEWLIKLGFDKKGDSMYGTKYIYPINDWGFTIEPSFENSKWFFGHEYYDSGDDKLDYQSLNFCFDLKYIHQLQNIYFALTGKELTAQ